MKKSHFIPPLLALLSCSEGGNQQNPGGPPPSPPVVAPGDADQTVHVPFNALLNGVQTGKSCRSEAEVRLPLWQTEWIASWQEMFDQSYQFQDPLGDAREGTRDLKTLGLIRSDDYLYVSLDFAHPDASGQLAFEFVRALRGEDEIVVEQKRFVRYEGGQFYVDGRSTPLPPELSEMSQAPEGALMVAKFSIPFLLGEVLTSPFWGVRVYDYEAELRHDFSAMVWMQGIAAKGYGFFSMNRCLADPFDALSLETQQISTGVTIDRWFDAYRFILNPVGQIIAPYSMPVGSLGLMLADHPLTWVPLPQIPSFAKDLLEHSLIHMQGEATHLTYGMTKKETFQVEADYKEQAIEEFYQQTFTLFLKGHHQDLDEAKRIFFTQALLSEAIKTSLGVPYWLSFLSRPGRGSLEKAGIVLAEILEAKKWLGHGWQNPDEFFPAIKAEHPNEIKLIEQLEAIVKEGSEATHLVDEYLSDLDQDGVLKFYEHRLGFASDDPDTDGDGWTDFAEIVGTELTNQLSPPGTALYFDGYFGDFLDLLPGKIAPKPKRPFGSCSGRGHFQSYLALMDGLHLLVGARVDDDHSGNPLRYEIEFDDAVSQQKGRVSFVVGDHHFTLYSQESEVLKVYRTAFPMGIHAVEALIPLEIYGITKEHDLKLKLTSFIHGETNEFCDEIPWFTPLPVSQ